MTEQQETRRLPDRFSGPGLVDLQVNGAGGFDFNGPPESWTAGSLMMVRSVLEERGLVAALPTLITDDAERMLARARRYSLLIGKEPLLASFFPRLHIEGPFVSKADGPRGVHPEAYCLTPSEAPDFLSRIRDAAGGLVGVVTLAPELPGALDLIERASGEGICVALGHTRASPETIGDAVTAGARLATHLGNGSDLLLPRSDNYVQAQLAEDRLFASFVADGFHLPFYTLKNFIRAKTPRRSVLVSDATAAAAAGPGRYRLGREEVVASDDLRVSSPGRPEFLAGSALTLDRAVIHVATRCGISFDDAWRMASSIPAALAGLPEQEQVTVDVSPQRFVRRE